MKINQVHIRNFRNFSAESQPISFADETTGKARELTVIAGSNGCGKTTILEMVFELVQMMVEPLISEDLFELLARKSYAGIDIDLTNSALNEAYTKTFRNEKLSQNIRLFNGNKKLIPEGKYVYVGTTEDTINHLPFNDNSVIAMAALNLRKINNSIATYDLDLLNKDSGLIFFPHDRWQQFAQTARVEEPPKSIEWCYRWEPTNKRAKNLAQFWVWQNYLDLEQSREGRANLAPFVEIIETILGRDQRVIIRKGKVYIRRPHLGDEIEPHELPAGEQQILTLFGELARWLRPGAIILIDEIESSLHPTLQRVALYHLRNLTRKYDLQVILTTHSMEIVDAVAPHEVINLDDMVLQERGRKGGSAAL